MNNQKPTFQQVEAFEEKFKLARKLYDAVDDKGSCSGHDVGPDDFLAVIAAWEVVRTTELANEVVKLFGDEPPNEVMALPDTISINWEIDDVRSRNEDNDGDELSDDQCRLVLEKIKNNHDANIGVNWEVIDFWIEQILKDEDAVAAGPSA